MGISGRRKRRAAEYDLPLRRFLHSAVSMDNYMLVLGGKTVSDNDYGDSREVALIYVYPCQMWIRVVLDFDDVMRGTGPLGGTAAAAGADGDVYVIGGYQYSRHGFINLGYYISIQNYIGFPPLRSDFQPTTPN